MHINNWSTNFQKISILMTMDLCFRFNSKEIKRKPKLCFIKRCKFESRVNSNLSHSVALWRTIYGCAWEIEGWFNARGKPWFREPIPWLEAMTLHVPIRRRWIASAVTWTSSSWSPVALSFTPTAPSKRAWGITDIRLRGDESHCECELGWLGYCIRRLRLCARWGGRHWPPFGSLRRRR